MATSRVSAALVAAALITAACADRTAAASRPDAAPSRSAEPGSPSGAELACAPAAAAGDAGTSTECTACVDRALTARGLNQFGDPPDTMYAGGTPLFDERTGKATDRIEYVLAHHPAIAAACGAVRPPGRPADR